MTIIPIRRDADSDYETECALAEPPLAPGGVDSLQAWPRVEDSGLVHDENGEAPRSEIAVRTNSGMPRVCLLSCSLEKPSPHNLTIRKP